MIIRDKDKVLCFGEILWDKLLTGPKPGGAPMNVAIHLKKTGTDVELVSSVGNDVDGNALKDFLRSEGISVKYIQTHKDLPTSTVLVKLDSNKNATYEICEPVAWDNILITTQLQDLIKEIGLIIFGSLASRNTQTRKTLEYILDSDAIKLLDVNLRSPYDKKEIIIDLLKHANIVKLNDDELKLICKWNNIEENTERQMITNISNTFDLSMVIVTRGENGAIVLENGIFTEHHGYPVKAVDTVGAGDSFLAAFIGKIMKGSSIKDSLEYACATGAFVASHEGATPKYNSSDILSIINK